MKKNIMLAAVFLCFSITANCVFSARYDFIDGLYIHRSTTEAHIHGPVYPSYPGTSDEILTYYVYPNTVEVDGYRNYQLLADSFGIDSRELFGILNFQDDINPDRSFFLRPLGIADAEEYVGMYAYPTEMIEYMHYYGRGAPLDPSDATNWFSMRLERMTTTNGNRPIGLYFMIVRPNGDVVGIIMIGSFFDTSPPEVAYIIKENYSGRGYATRSLLMIIDIVRRFYPGTTDIVATVHPENVGSQRVLEKNGFTTDGKVTNIEEKGPRFTYKRKI